MAILTYTKANTQEDHVKQRKIENCYQIYILFMNIFFYDIQLFK